MSLTIIQQYCILEQNKQSLSQSNGHCNNVNPYYSVEFNFIEKVVKFLSEKQPKDKAQTSHSNKSFNLLFNSLQILHLESSLRHYFEIQEQEATNDSNSIPNSWNALSNSFLRSKHRQVKLKASGMKSGKRSKQMPSQFKQKHEIEQFQDPTTSSTQNSNLVEGIYSNDKKLTSPFSDRAEDNSFQKQSESIKKKKKQSTAKRLPKVDFKVIQKRNSDILQNLNYIRKQSLKNIQNLNFDKVYYLINHDFILKRNSQFILNQQGNFTLPTMEKQESMLKVIQRASKQIDPQVDLKPLQFNELLELQCKNYQNEQEISSSEDDDESIISEDEDFYRAIEEDEKSEKQQSTFLLKVNVKKFGDIVFPQIIEQNLSGLDDIQVSNALVSKANLGEFSYQQEETRKMLGYNQNAIEPLNYKEQVELKQRLNKLTILPFYYYTKFGIKSNQIKCYDNKPYFRMKDFYNNSPDRSLVYKPPNEQENEIYSLKTSPIKGDPHCKPIEFKTSENIVMTNQQIPSQQQFSQQEIITSDLDYFRNENLLCLQFGLLPLQETQQNQQQTFYLKNFNQFQENVAKESFSLTIKNNKLFSHLIQPESLKLFNEKPIFDLIVDTNKNEFIQKLEKLNQLSPKNLSNQSLIGQQTERIFIRDLGTIQGTFVQLHLDNPIILEPNSLIMLNQQAGFYVKSIINSNETIYEINNKEELIKEFEDFDLMNIYQNCIAINLFEKLPVELQANLEQKDFELLKEIQKEFKQPQKQSSLLLKKIKALQKVLAQKDRTKLKKNLISHPAIKLMFIKLNHDPHFYEEKSTLVITNQFQKENQEETTSLIFGNDYLPINFSGIDFKSKLHLISQVELPYKLELEYNSKLKIWALVNKGLNTRNQICLDEYAETSQVHSTQTAFNNYNILRTPTYSSPFHQIYPGINTLSSFNIQENQNMPLEDFFSLHSLQSELGPWVKINTNNQTDYLKNIANNGEFVEIGCNRDNSMNISIMDGYFEFNLQALRIQDVSNPNCLEFLSPQYPMSYPKKVKLSKKEEKSNFKIENFNIKN